MTEGQSFQNELQRIYWTRQSLRLLVAVSAAWLFAAIFPFFAKQRVIGASDTGSASSVLQEVFGRLWIAIGPPTVAIVMLLVVAVVLRTTDVRRRDPRRRFTRYQRHEGMKRASGRCELEPGFGRRCARAAEHGDHFYRWSKGGATSLQNFVAACSHCNRRVRAPVSRAPVCYRALSVVVLRM
ncbi:HNH endonuclease [Arthrobacter sp. ISL-95]|uniref:HNH endonuclease n=1 Tax=Arthrobacter sp. ISL-95 TaxID=2819116 RepID=UPI0037C097EB